ncbi:hypothetical protein ROA7023_04255 [Roseisalinus antarcticus]|uniref:Uncharacterized protein n=2 Tax=Roseisalinus antarcticus TaxID=254357 RepID=A0A1Y5TYB1_9RHOB|nr:hypothetical protein ROA7023_04255 [Roseisalinus antarcticus]
MALFAADAPGAPLAAPATTDDSVLCPPMAQLDAPPRPLPEVYGGQGRFWARLAAQAAAEGDRHMADLMDKLAERLRDGSLDWEGAPAPAQRLTRYVYPVV